MTGFPGALGVVCVELSTGTKLATLPAPMQQAGKYAAKLANLVEDQADSSSLIGFDIANGALDCWIRARDVLLIQVIATEDPGAGS